MIDSIMIKKELSGFLFINKPPNITSFGCIKQLKKFLPKNTKIGHTGTLDDLAEGLLIVCIDRKATKLTNSLMKLNKQYVAQAKLGELTDTLDCAGTVLKQKEISKIDKKQLQKALKLLGKQYLQTPPVYSALKYKGEPLYKLARQQKIDLKKLTKIIEDKKKIVHIYASELTEFKPPYFTVKVDVSKGTYIRSFVNDIAKKIGNFATTYKLKRTKIGPFLLKKAVNLSKIISLEKLKKHLNPIEEIKEKLEKT